MITLSFSYSVGAHDAFICENGEGGGGVLNLVYGSSFLPLHGLYCVQ